MLAKRACRSPPKLNTQPHVSLARPATEKARRSGAKSTIRVCRKCKERQTLRARIRLARAYPSLARPDD